MRALKICLSVLLITSVCSTARAQGGGVCANSFVWDFDLPVFSLVAGYPSGITQNAIEDYFLEAANRDSGLNDASCCQGINVRILPSSLPTSCLTINDTGPSENIGSCAQAAGPFSITIVESIPTCGGGANVDGCTDPQNGWAMFMARSNAYFPPTDVPALTNDLTAMALIRQTQNPYFPSSGPPGDLFGVGMWSGNISTSTCLQMQQFAGAVLPVTCSCSPSCITDNDDALPHGDSCLVDGVGPILTCNHGVCDGPAGNDCILKGGDRDGDLVCDNGDGIGSIHSGNICSFAQATPPDCDDNCPNHPNPDQANTTGDGDTWGDVCDRCPEEFDTAVGPDYYQEDTDFDNVPDACDNCNDEGNPVQEDFDGDLAGDACDNCITVPNIQTENADGDAFGDECDSTPYPPGNPLNADADGDGMPLYVEQLAGTSDSDTDSDNDGISDWIEWTVHGTNPAAADTDGDGIADPAELAQGSDPRDPMSFFGLCGDVNLDMVVNLVDSLIVRRQLASSAVPSSFTPARCDFVSAGACTTSDVAELRAFLADPAGSPLADTCPGVPHEVTTVLFNMDGQASAWIPISSTSTDFDEQFIVYEGTGSLRVVSNFAFADASTAASFSPMVWTDNLLRFAMLVPSTAFVGASDGIRITISSSTTSAASDNRTWFFGTLNVPQGIWKTYEIDPSVGWDQATGIFNINQVQRMRIDWNLNEGAGRVAGEALYLDDFKLVNPASQ